MYHVESVSQPWIEPTAPALEAQNPNHCSTREVPPWCSVGCGHGIYGGEEEKVGGVLGKREDIGGLCGGLEEGSGAQALIVWHVGVTCGIGVQTEVNCSSPSALPHHPLNRYGGEFLDFFL